MKKIPLGGNKKGSVLNGYAIVDDEDYDVINSMHWYNANGYAVRSIYFGKKDGKQIKKRVQMHRLILMVSNETLVDHKNRNRLDNRKCNLRVCTHRENSINVTKKIGKSGYRGVTINNKDGKWKVTVTRYGKKRHCGMFSNKIDAARKYNEEAIKEYGEFAVLNTID